MSAQPPLQVSEGRCCYLPRYEWAWEDVPAIAGARRTRELERRLVRRVPDQALERAAELEELVLGWLEERGCPAPPPPGSIAARVLRVAEMVPRGQKQRVVAILKDDPPFWGVTTERVRG